MEVKLQLRLTDGNTFSIALGSAYFDYITSKETKTYNLDLNDDQIDEGKTVLFSFVTYAGSPKVKVGFEPTFESVLKGT